MNIFSYFGQGLVKNQCGITIKQPIQEDYGVWRCSIGFRIDHNTTKNFDRILTLHKPGDFYLFKNYLINNQRYKFKSFIQFFFTISLKISYSIEIFDN